GEGLEHQVELARFGHEALGATGRRRAAAVLGHRAALLLEMVLAEARLADLAVDQQVGEAGKMSGGLPHSRVLDDRRVETDDVLARGDHRPPPGLLDVALEFDAERAVVVAGVDPAVDLAALEHEAAP